MLRQLACGALVRMEGSRGERTGERLCVSWRAFASTVQLCWKRAPIRATHTPTRAHTHTHSLPFPSHPASQSHGAAASTDPTTGARITEEPDAAAESPAARRVDARAHTHTRFREEQMLLTQPSHSSSSCR